MPKSQQDFFTEAPRPRRLLARLALVGRLTLPAATLAAADAALLAAAHLAGAAPVEAGARGGRAANAPFADNRRLSAEYRPNWACFCDIPHIVGAVIRKASASRCPAAP